MYSMEERVIEVQEDVDDFWNSEKDDLWAQKILDTNVDLDKATW
jgi:hypothetical protein